MKRTKLTIRLDRDTLLAEAKQYANWHNTLCPGGGRRIYAG